MADYENIYGIKYEVDVSELTSSTKEAIQQIKLANANFQKATSGMDDWSNSVEGLEAKLTQLNSVLDAERSKLAQQKKSYNDLSREYEDNEKQIDELKRAKQRLIDLYGEESAEVKANVNEVKRLERSQTSLRASMDRANISIIKQEANINKTEKELSDYEDKLHDVKLGLNNVEDASDETGDGFTTLKGVLADLISNGIQAFISGIGNAIEETREFRKEMALLESVAKENEVAFDKVKKSYMDLLATSGDEGATTETLNNLLTAGFDESNLDQIVAGVEGLAIRFKDTLKQEGIADSIQEWIGSEGESLTGNFAEALERMGYNLEDVTAQTKGFTDEQRQQWVINTLNKEGLNELSQAYRDQNADLIESSNAQFKLTDAIAKFGAVAEPVLSAVKSGFADVLNALFGASNIDLSPLTNAISSVFSTISNLLSGELSFTDFINNIYESIMTGVPLLLESGKQIISNLGNGIKNNLPLLLENGLEMVQNFATLIYDNAPALLESGIEFIRNIVKGLMDSLPILIENVPTIVSTIANVINDNAFTIIKAGFNIILDIIKGLINAIPTLIASIPKIITAIVDVWEAFNWINLGTKAITFLKDGIMSMIGAVKNSALSVQTNVTSVIAELPAKLHTFGTNMMTNFKGAIDGAISSVTTAVKGIFNAVVNGLSGLPSKMLEIGKDLVKGLWNGISDMSGWVIGKIQSFSSSVLEGIKNFFGVHSPSRETYWIGEMLAEGLGNAISDSVKSVQSQAELLADAVLDTLHSNLDDVSLNPNLIDNFKADAGMLNTRLNPAMAGVSAGAVTNVTFNQTNYSPKAIDSLQTYLNTQKQLKQYKLWRGR